MSRDIGLNRIAGVLTWRAHVIPVSALHSLSALAQSSARLPQAPAANRCIRQHEHSQRETPRAFVPEHSFCNYALPSSPTSRHCHRDLAIHCLPGHASQALPPKPSPHLAALTLCLLPATHAAPPKEAIHILSPDIPSTLELPNSACMGNAEAP